MKRHFTIATAICFLVVWSGAVLGADSWPIWRGPTANGVAPEGCKPPTEWSESKNIKWKIAFPGTGTSSPIIWDNMIFFQTAVDTEKTPPAAPKNLAMSEGRFSFVSAQDRGGQFGQRRRGGTSGRGGPGGSRGRGGFGGGSAPKTLHHFDVVCLDRGNGKVLWQTPVREVLPHEGAHRNHGFASYTPVTDGKHIWVSFGSRGVHCLDMKGNLKWSKDLVKMSTRASFGEGSSPAIAGDALIVVADHEGASKIFAFDKLTGDLLWEKDRDEQTSWATPLTLTVGGKLQVVTSATNFIRSYDPKTGDIIWQCSGQTSNVIPTPVYAFGMVFCTSGFRGNSLQAIELGRTGDLSDTDAVKWQLGRATPYVPSPILYGENIYVCSGNKAIISSYHAKTGEPNYEQQRIEGMGEVYASPVAANGNVYFVGRDGKTAVVKNTKDFQLVALNVLDDPMDASPAVVGNELYLKGKEYLYCVAAN